jgi:hypothetical protein
MQANTTTQIETGPVTRRSLFKTAAIVTGAAAASAFLPKQSLADSKTLTWRNIPMPGYLNLLGIDAGYDVKVLNYALLLEDLEADLYQQALARLTVGGATDSGVAIPGLGLSMAEPDVHFINEFASVEAEHRDFIRGSLNSLINGIAIKPSKHEFGISSLDREGVLALVLTAEALGVSAYLGAVPKLKTRAFITAAAAIQGTEARHTAVLTTVQNVLFNGSNSKPVAPLASTNNGMDTPMDPDTVLAQVSQYIVS